ncbi:hypothetical protein [Paenibacillus caui]|uniref:hypothetical protein n=1 Tax=Paenibacillus caui TaxID=2873927 RepID=UPI001CA8FADB|nr:hypothetical protein [Paenibacillus caui]
MNAWKDSMILMKKEWDTERFTLLWNFVFMIYTAGGISLLLFGSRSDEAADILSPAVDFMFLIFAPITGSYFSRRSFRYLKDDSYTQMLLYYRILPIPLQSIVFSRFLQAVAALIFNGLVYYATIYFLSGGLNDRIHGFDYAAFALTWTGYGLVTTGLYIYFEFLRSGRTYMWMSFAHMGIAVLAAIAIMMMKGSLLGYTLQVSRHFGLLSPLMWGSLVLGAISLALFYRVILRKLEVRDLV